MRTRGLTLFLTLVAAGTAAAAPRHTQRTLALADGTRVTYGLSVPDGDPKTPRPLVIALHPGGSRPYYGDAFLQDIFLPGLETLEPIMAAPDVVGPSWTDPRSEQAVLALVDALRREFAVDARRLLLIGFSMGGAGTWFMAARHPDRFTGAIVIAGRTDEPLASLGRIPTYVIHSRGDQVVPFPQAEARASALEKEGRPVAFEALSGIGHYEMGNYVDAIARAGRWIAARWSR